MKNYSILSLGLIILSSYGYSQESIENSAEVNLEVLEAQLATSQDELAQVIKQIKTASGKQLVTLNTLKGDIEYEISVIVSYFSDVNVMQTIPPEKPDDILLDELLND